MVERFFKSWRKHSRNIFFIKSLPIKINSYISDKDQSRGAIDIKEKFSLLKIKTMTVLLILRGNGTFRSFFARDITGVLFIAASRFLLV